MVEQIRNVNSTEHTFEAGTLDGLMQAMPQNDNCFLSFYYEFSTFNDLLHRGITGDLDRSRFFTLFNGGGKLQKMTKTSSDFHVKCPRFNLYTFTPYYIQILTEGNIDVSSPFFIVSFPPEKDVLIEEKK